MDQPGAHDPQRPTATEWLGLALLTTATGLALAFLPSLLGHLYGTDLASVRPLLVVAWLAALIGYLLPRERHALPWQRSLSRREQAWVYGSGGMVCAAWLVAGGVARMPDGSYRGAALAGAVGACCLGAVCALEIVQSVAVWQSARTRGSLPPGLSSYATTFVCTSLAGLFGALLFALAGYGIAPKWQAAMAGFLLGGALGMPSAPFFFSARATWVSCNPYTRLGTVLASIALTVAAVLTIPPVGAFEPLQRQLTARGPFVAGFGYLCAGLLPLLLWFCYTMAAARLAREQGRWAPILAVATVAWPWLVVLQGGGDGDALGVGLFAQLFGLFVVYMAEALPQALVDSEPTATYHWLCGELAARLCGFWAVAWLSLLTVVPVADSSAAWFDWLLGHFTALPR